jgi:hypothetical protein
MVVNEGHFGAGSEIRRREEFDLRHLQTDQSLKMMPLELSLTLI